MKLNMVMKNVILIMVITVAMEVIRIYANYVNANRYQIDFNFLKIQTLIIHYVSNQGPGESCDHNIQCTKNTQCCTNSCSGCVNIHNIKQFPCMDRHHCQKEFDKLDENNLVCYGDVICRLPPIQKKWKNQIENENDFTNYGETDNVEY